MPEVNQYQFKLREIAEALVKQAGLHEGRWQLIITFGFGAANLGPSPEEVMPGAAVSVQTIGLLRAQPDSPPALIVDAAEVNPEAPKPKGKQMKVRAI